MTIRLEQSDMVMIEEVAKALGFTNSEAMRMLIRIGIESLSNQMGTPPLRGGNAAAASNRASGEAR